MNGLVGKIKFPNDIVLKDADFMQSISGIAVNDINVSGKITVEGKINSIDYNIACDLIAGPNPGPYGLILERMCDANIYNNKKHFFFLKANFPGDANFDHAPQIENLNGQNVNQLYNEAWLLNQNAELTGSLRFLDVEFSKPIEVKVISYINLRFNQWNVTKQKKNSFNVQGLLNGIDVGYLGNHYVSLTKPQEIITEIEINGNVLFQSDIRSGSIQMNGVIKDSNRSFFLLKLIN